jgi:RHS repeat-associated protein
VTLKVRVDANDDVEVWVGGTSKIVDTNGLDVPTGNVALAGEKAIFDNVKVGYDTGSDDVIDDYVVNETFGGTDITPTYDDNGNLTFDGSFKYTYDAWNRLVKATLDDTDVTIHEAAFDGLGRRVVKTVSNSGDLDGVTEYYHNSNQIIETRDGSGNLETQVYHGTQYIDEVVGQRIANMGRVYVHQDANYNVTGTTDLTARQIERNYYSPYGQLEVAVDSHPFDYDDDGDVDADDYAVTTNGTCTGTATGDCRRMDADADGDVDSTDQTTIANYIATLTTDTELTRVPAATESQRGNLYGHQGLVFDAELGSYQNRARQYAPATRRFLQRDPLGLIIIEDSMGQPVLKLASAETPQGIKSYFPDEALMYRDGMNIYQYVRTSPLTKRDPVGLCCGPCTGRNAGLSGSPAATCDDGNGFMPGSKVGCTKSPNSGSSCNCTPIGTTTGATGGGSQQCKTCFVCQPGGSWKIIPFGTSICL